MGASVLGVAVWLGDGLDPVQRVGQDPENLVSPGLAGFLAVFFVAIATVLLVRSMTTHLRRVRYSTPPGEEGPTDVPGRDDPTQQD